MGAWNLGRDLEQAGLRAPSVSYLLYSDSGSCYAREAASQEQGTSNSFHRPLAEDKLGCSVNQIIQLPAAHFHFY
jgi:hypothetical protein